MLLKSNFFAIFIYNCRFLCYNEFMKKIKIIKVASYNNLELEKISNNSNTLFITATKSLSYQSNKNKQQSVIDYTLLVSNINKQTKEKNCLLKSEMRYFLHKAISSVKNENLKNAYFNSINLISELFNNLLLADIKENDINFKQIEQNYLYSNYELFALYVEYINLLNKQDKKDYPTTFKNCLKEYLKKYENVYLCGFTFFNDNQYALFKILIELGVEFSFIVNDNFIINDFIEPLLNKHSLNYEKLEHDNKEELKFDALRTAIFNDKKVNSDIKNCLQFYKPFYTREMEFSFIAKQIQKRIKQFSSVNEIEQECNKIAIVITNQFAKQTKIFNDIFKNIGVFVAPNGNLFYSQEEFLLSDYSAKLSKEQRLEEFASFKRLEVYEPPKNLFNSMLGKFIAEIYKISAYGMNLSNFNTLLQINWLFKNTKINNIISEFNSIKDFFEMFEKITDWKTQIEKLIELKKNLTFESELHNHPLKSVALESLEFIKSYISFIDNVISKLNNVNGNVKTHIKTLIEAIKAETDNELIEKELLSEFEDLLNFDNDGVNIDYEYFAKNFQSLINEYLTSKTEKTNNIRINAINLESANSFDIVFVPMFEENKYPMAFKYEFPYTKEIVEILLKSVSNYYLPLNKTLEYNLKLSKYVFENLFRITKEQIIFTRIESENGTPIHQSIYGYDIKAKFDNIEELCEEDKSLFLDKNLKIDILRKDTDLSDLYLNEMLQYFVCPKMFFYSMRFKDNNCFKDKFLVNFYCKALIVYNTLSALANGSIYNKEKLLNSVEESINNIANEVFNILPMFDDNNKNDILLSAKNQVNTFIQDKILTGRYKPSAEFSLTLSNAKVIKHKNINVKTHRNLIVKDIRKNVSYEFDISKSLDLLISSSGGRTTEMQHFFEIIDEMENNSGNLDYANSVNFLSFKLNTQLNTEKYKEDGIKRVKQIIEILDERSYNNLCYRKSSFCTFCKYKNICLGGIDNE